MPGSEPNVENKLFVGGCPAGSIEDELRKIFESYGTIEEIFIMRGGSRSGMACAFVRFQTQQMAQAAIDAIHGQITLPGASEPLVVRWADAPGTRRRSSRRGGSGRVGGSGGHDHRSAMSSQHGQPVYVAHGGYSYGTMPVTMPVQMPMQAIGGGYGSMPFYPHTVGGYAGGHMGYLPQQHAMLAYQQQQQQQALGSAYTQQTASLGTPQLMVPGMHASGMNPVMALGQYNYSGAMSPVDQGEALPGGPRGPPSARAPPPPGHGTQPPPRCGPPRGYPTS